MREQPSTGVLVGMVLAFGLAVTGLIGTAVVLRGGEGGTGSDTIDISGLQPLAPRAVYLADGTPAYVIAHADGAISLLSAFDAHRPYGFGQMVWWCPLSEAFEGPSTGARYDEYGTKFSGPAPSGLAGWTLSVEGGVARVGTALVPSGLDTPALGAAPQDRPACGGQDPIVLPGFEGWKIWDSPSALVRAAPSRWALITGDLTASSDGLQLCALTGCADAVPAPELEPPGPEYTSMLHSPTTLWLVRVDAGALVGVTRVIDPGDWILRRT